VLGGDRGVSSARRVSGRNRHTGEFFLINPITIATVIGKAVLSSVVGTGQEVHPYSEATVTCRRYAVLNSSW